MRCSWRNGRSLASRIRASESVALDSPVQRAAAQPDFGPILDDETDGARRLQSPPKVFFGHVDLGLDEEKAAAGFQQIEYLGEEGPRVGNLMDHCKGEREIETPGQIIDGEGCRRANAARSSA